MPQFVETVVKHLHIPIPVKRDLPSELISLIELKDITIRLSKDYPRPLITGAIRTELRIPRGMRKLKFVTDGIKAEFYLLHPKDHSRRIALLKTERWDECCNGQTKKIWEIEAMVRDAPVEIIDCEGFDEWIKMMLALKGEEMEAFVEGSCAAGIKTLGTKLKIKKIPVKAKLNIPGTVLGWVHLTKGYRNLNNWIPNVKTIYIVLKPVNLTQSLQFMSSFRTLRLTDFSLSIYTSICTMTTSA